MLHTVEFLYQKLVGREQTNEVCSCGLEDESFLHRRRVVYSSTFRSHSSKMKSAVLSACVLLSFIALSQANTCSSFVNNQVCKQSSNLEVDVKLCSAQYEGYPEMLPKFRKYINEHIATSYQYTLMVSLL